MTDLKKKLDETKRQIRSLLESAPLGLTLQELKKDFKQYIGPYFPTRDLGYSRDEEFLKDISDVVQISFRGDTMVLHAVSGKETEHLVNMINRQKIDPKKRWGVLNCPRYGKTYSQTPKPLFQRNYGSNSMDWRSSGGNNYQQHYQQRNNRVSQRPTPSVPAFVRGQIFSLVKDTPDGLPLIYFRSFFRKTFGFPLEPEALGFSHEEEMLKSLSDMVQLVRLGGEVRVMPLQATVNMNRNGNNFEQPPGRTEQKTEPRDDKQSSKATEVEYHCNIPRAFQNYVIQVISKFPKGVKLSQFPLEFKSTHKMDLPIKTYGYNSVIEFLSDLPHIIYIERPHAQGDWVLYPAELKPEKKEKSTVRDTECVEDMDITVVEIDQAAKDAIVQVLAMHKDGIPLSKFESTFREMTGKPLNAEQYCEGGVKQLLLSLSDIVLISICPKEKYRVFLRQDVQVMGGSRKFDKLNSNYQPLMTQDNEQRGEATSLPHDVVGLGCYYKPQPIPLLDNEHQYISLYVSYVISPCLFWIQIRGANTTIALEDMMDDLEKVYDSKKLSKDYFMTAKIAQKGLLCAAIFPEDGFWYRGVITDVKEPFYEVLYVDYGNSCSVSLNQLRLLKSKFIKFPAQAIQANLSHVHPVGQTWAAGAKEKLLALSKERPLYGLVTNIKDRVLSLCLIDTSDKDKDIHINDILVKEGYGRFVKDDQLLEPQTQNNELAFGQEEPEQTPARTRVYVRQVKITESVLMTLINLDDHPYLLSFEISKLFFQQDIIGSKLKQANIDVKKITVNKANYPELFEELLLYEVNNITPKSEMLSLFSLSGFPVILKLFGKGDEFEDMRQTAQDLLTWFDPEDPYWKGEGGAGSGSSSTQEDVDSEGSPVEGPTMEEVNSCLQKLREMRQGILDMMFRGRCGEETVNALADVESKIKKVEDYARSQEKALGKSSSSSSSDSRQNYQHTAMDGASSQGKSSQQKHKEEAFVQASQSKPSVSEVSLMSPLNIRVPGDSSQQSNTSSVGQSSGLSCLNPALVNQQLLALLQQQMLQAQLQQSALGLQALHFPFNPLSPSLNLFNTAGSNYPSYLLNDQLQASSLLLQNSSLQQQQMNAFASALASLSLGSVPPAQNPTDGLRAPSGARLSECNSVEPQQTTSSASLTPLQHRQLLQQFQTNMTSSR